MKFWSGVLLIIAMFVAQVSVAKSGPSCDALLLVSDDRVVFTGEPIEMTRAGVDDFLHRRLPQWINDFKTNYGDIRFQPDLEVKYRSPIDHKVEFTVGQLLKLRSSQGDPISAMYVGAGYDFSGPMFENVRRPDSFFTIAYGAIAQLLESALKENLKFEEVLFLSLPLFRAGDAPLKLRFGIDPIPPRGTYGFGSWIDDFSELYYSLLMGAGILPLGHESPSHDLAHVLDYSLHPRVMPVLIRFYQTKNHYLSTSRSKRAAKLRELFYKKKFEEPLNEFGSIPLLISSDLKQEIFGQTDYEKQSISELTKTSSLIVERFFDWASLRGGAMNDGYNSYRRLDAAELMRQATLRLRSIPAQERALKYDANGLVAESLYGLKLQLKMILDLIQKSPREVRRDRNAKRLFGFYRHFGLFDSYRDLSMHSLFGEVGGLLRDLSFQFPISMSDQELYQVLRKVLVGTLKQIETTVTAAQKYQITQEQVIQDYELIFSDNPAAYFESVTYRYFLETAMVGGTTYRVFVEIPNLD